MTDGPKLHPLPADIAFLTALGGELLNMGNGQAQIALNLKRHHMNSGMVSRTVVWP